MIREPHTEKTLLSREEATDKGYIGPPDFVPGRGRIPDKYIYYTYKTTKATMNALAGIMDSKKFFNGLPPAHPILPPPAFPYYHMPYPVAPAIPVMASSAAQPFVLQPPTFVMNNQKRRNIHESVVAEFGPPPHKNNNNNNNMGGIVGQLQGVHMTDGGRRRKSRRNLKKKAKKTHRRRK